MAALPGLCTGSQINYSTKFLNYSHRCLFRGLDYLYKDFSARLACHVILLFIQSCFGCWYCSLFIFFVRAPVRWGIGSGLRSVWKSTAITVKPPLFPEMLTLIFCTLCMTAVARRFPSVLRGGQIYTIKWYRKLYLKIVLWYQKWLKKMQFPFWKEKHAFKITQYSLLILFSPETMKSFQNFTYSYHKWYYFILNLWEIVMLCHTRIYLHTYVCMSVIRFLAKTRVIDSHLQNFLWVNKNDRIAYTYRYMYYT